jgi:hypothetical protein
MKFDLKQAMADAMARHYAEFPDEAPGPTKPEPKTETGKQRASLNAYKHGLTGQIHVFSPEEHAAFEKHCESITEDLAPVGATERQLAQSIAENHWRLNRARAIEACTFSCTQSSMESVDPAYQPMMQAIANAKTWMQQGNNLQLLSLYEQRIQRSIERSMAELRTLRAERKAARDRALEEAVLLAQLAKSKGETYNLAADFPNSNSVFSTTEWQPQFARKQRLDEARALPKTRQMPAAA